MDTITAKIIQEVIFAESGLKTSVKNGTGSMSGYVIIWPMFQNGQYPSIPFDLCQRLKTELSQYNHEQKPLFSTTSEISVYGILNDAIKFKHERKAKTMEESSVKSWGSKNSQLRLDKAAARYAKKLRRGENVARYN